MVPSISFKLDPLRVLCYQAAGNIFHTPIFVVNTLMTRTNLGILWFGLARRINYLSNSYSYAENPDGTSILIAL